MTLFTVIMAATFLIAGSGLLYVGILAGSGKLPMNSWVGLRTPKLMASEEEWVRGHKAGSGYLKFSGVFMFAGGVLFFFIDDSTISFVSMPVVIVLLICTVLANQKANAAVAK